MKFELQKLIHPIESRRPIFPQPIADLSKIGTRRQWLMDALALALLAAAAIFFLIAP